MNPFCAFGQNLTSHLIAFTSIELCCITYINKKKSEPHNPLLFFGQQSVNN